MVLAFVFYYDPLAHDDRKRIDTYCNMANMRHFIIDKTKTLKTSNGNVFRNIGDVVKNFTGHEMVFLDPLAKTSISEYQHPEKNVLYFVGSDDTGFQKYEIEKHNVFKIYTEKINQEWHAVDVVPMVIAERMIQRRNNG